MQSAGDTSTGVHNLEAGGASLILGLVTMGTGNSLLRSGNNYVARQFNERVDTGAALGGAAVDFLASYMPDMSPAEATCPE